MDSFVSSEEKKELLKLFPIVCESSDDKKSMEEKQMIRFDGLQVSIVIDDEEFSVTFDAVDCITSNDGIGAYEFHGQKGVDHGRDYVESYTIQNLRIINEEGRPVQNPDCRYLILKKMERSRSVDEAVNQAFNESLEPE